MEEARYVFEAKTIQRMELLVLSTLKWRMHPVTPISFFDHIIRRLGSECHQQLDLFRDCECLLISVVAGEVSHFYKPFFYDDDSWCLNCGILDYRYEVYELRPFCVSNCDNDLCHQGLETM